MHSTCTFDFAAAERTLATLAATNARMAGIRASATGGRPGGGRYVSWADTDDDRADPVRRRRTAAHESGHAVRAALVWGVECLRGIDLAPADADPDSWWGRCEIAEPRGRTAQDALRVSAAGPAAELLLLGGVFPGFRLDISGELEQVRGMGLAITDDAWHALVFAEERGLRQHGRTIAALAAALYDAGSLDAQEERAVVRQHLWS